MIINENAFKALENDTVSAIFRDLLANQDAIDDALSILGPYHFKRVFSAAMLLIPKLSAAPCNQ